MDGNPFEDDDADYLVLVNELNQHSLWPVELGRPAGWQAVYGPAGRQDCLQYVDDNWLLSATGAHGPATN